MTRPVFIAILLALAGSPAYADSCDKSRTYLLGGLGGELMRPPTEYDHLFKQCLATAAMANVKDAYVLQDGGIAVIPKQDTIAATAATLSQFCDAYPRSTLHFLTRRELAADKSLADIVRISSTSSTSCPKIKGLAQ
ncbi:hypothetical protein [Bradyrhizobium sp. Tv2a-2]|uniref:hypothetical protein n=1 Tax=Bradyrhizobium sp. Tv2a-2 TaxID=113395 RepID=UPI00040A9979|nr:hypothetical protein [Bradyrhizobium sp. Tv2a-2]